MLKRCSGALPLLLFKSVAQPYHRGFYCDDESIQYPYKDSTVTSPMLYGIGFSLNIAVILIMEYIRTKCPGTKVCLSQQPEGDSDQRESTNQTSRLKRHLYKYFAAAFHVLLPFMFGAVMQQVTTDIAKYAVGRLRPHFMLVCKPDTTKFDCSLGYVEEDVCTGEPAMIREARLSFPSGHASFSTYTMMFLMLYIQARLRWRRVRLLRPFLQMLAFSLAFYCSLSRISDYKHHWSDVLGGAIIGVVGALLTVFKVSSLFEEKEAESKTYNTHVSKMAENSSSESSTKYTELNNRNSYGNTSPEGDLPDGFKGSSQNHLQGNNFEGQHTNLFVIPDNREGPYQSSNHSRMMNHRQLEHTHSDNAWNVNRQGQGLGQGQTHSKVSTNL